MKRRWLIVEVMLLALPSCLYGELRGDLNGDGRVNLLDLSILAEEWLMSDTYLYFNGLGAVYVSDYEETEPEESDFSIALWVKPEVAEPLQYVIHKDDGLYKWGVFLANGAPRMLLERDYNYTGTALATINTGVWTHIAFSIDRDDSVICYINGAAVELDNDDPSAASGDITINTDLSLGVGGGAGQIYVGGMDDIRIFKTALSPAQVAAIYNNGRGGKAKNSDFAAIDGWYSNCDDGEGEYMTAFRIASGVAWPNNGHLNFLPNVSWMAGGTPFLTEPSPPYLRDRWAGLMRSRY
ncbi:MAG: LamG domain-containing protein [Sedimentisphaerales bacterium]|nr:LamG domain-containing protein [Sedimentisphaerales bacterium]